MMIFLLLYMTSKTLQIRKDVYDRLQEHRQPHDNFNIIVVRLLDRWENFYALS